MIKRLLSLILLLTVTGAYAQPPGLDAASIPASLKKNANSVKREERISFEVKAADKAYKKVHQVITILSEAGKEELFFYEFADKFHSLEDVELELYNSRGISLHKYSRSDLTKQTAGDGLVPDGKVYYLNITAPEYPVTLRIDYEIKYNGILNYPDYSLQLPEQAVENSVFSVRVPTDMGLRYKPKNTTNSPTITEDGNYKLYTWSVKNLPALEYEEGSVSRESRYPRILLAPNKFELDGYAGDMSSWQQFGYWYGRLAKNAMNLSEERKQFFLAMVKDAADDREKIKRIYSYVQNNCRYVLIALGIGGYKPFEADFVDKKKYGDCKALSNYTQACLNAVGIKSYQALINADYNKEPVDPDFPYNGFNHVIVCVPMDKDSVWLECTSTTVECGVLGNFTENRNALLITEDGGKLVATPRSRATENELSTNERIILNTDGSGTAKVVLRGTGEYKQIFLHYFGEQVKDEQKKYLVNDMGFIQPDEFEIRYDKKNNQNLVEATMSIEKVPDFTAGSKMFLNPRIYKLWSYALPKSENRTQDFYFYHPLIKTDTTTYHLPDGYGIEAMPKTRELKFEYGTYTTSYVFDEKQKTITTTARLVLNEYKIPVEKFLETKKFFNDVLAEYTEKIIIKRL